MKTVKAKLPYIIAALAILFAVLVGIYEGTKPEKAEPEPTETAAAYAARLSDDYWDGYYAGMEAGHDDGYEEGLNDGWWSGWYSGYDCGYDDGSEHRDYNEVPPDYLGP